MFLLLQSHRDFASVEATKGLSDRPLETFGGILLGSHKAHDLLHTTYTKR